MATTHAEAFIARDPDEVWDIFGNFAGLASWFPNLPEIKVDGLVRVVTMGPGVDVTETEIARDNGSRTYSYTVAAPVIPATKYVTTCSVTAAPGGCVAAMDAVLEPDEMAAMIGPLYTQAVAALAQHFA